MEKGAQQADYTFKMILLGSSGVGKSNVLMRYTRDQFSELHQATVGVQFATKTLEVNDKRIKLQIWDTAGQQQYKAITRTFYKGASAVMLMYDISSERTFEDLEGWYKQIKEYSKSEIVIMLVGNKSDMEEQRAVSKQKGFQYAENKKIAFYQISAKTNTNVSLVFTKIAQELEKLMTEAEKIKNTVDTNSGQKEQPSPKKQGTGSVKKLSQSVAAKPKKKEGCCSKS